MYKVLVTPLEQIGRFSNALSILERKGCEIIRSSYPHPVAEKDLERIIRGIDAIIAGNDELTAKVIQAADKLRVVSRYGSGMNTVDVEAATKKRIVVTYTPNHNAVADFTIGLMLCLARRICEANVSVKSGNWERPFLGMDLCRKTLGVIGTGRIGQAVIRRVKGFEMKVLAYDIQENQRMAEELELNYVSLKELLEQADFVSIHVPLCDETNGLIGEKAIGLMKSSAYLINVARGGIVDEEALYQALKEKRLAGAALDVYAQEPPSRRHPLLKLENVIATPHMGVDSREVIKNMDLIATENVLKVLNGQAPLYAVNLPFPEAE